MSENQNTLSFSRSNPWPLVTALALLVLCYGLVLCSSRKLYHVLYRGRTVLLASALWWRDVVKESKSGSFTIRLFKLVLDME